MNLQKLISTREGHRRPISRQLEKFNSELSPSEKIALLEITQEKADIIKTLNEKILNHTEVPDLETELVEAEEYSIDLHLKLRKLRDEITSKNTPVNTNRSARNGTDSEVSVQSNSTFLSASCNRLPKLSLPTFNGEVAQWQSFWDPYESAVHSNPTLSDVQKFNYLRSLLHDTAATAIAGFPLTQANYTNAIDLLKERFGQIHKIIDTYMQSLLDLPVPDNNVTSLRNFHDKMEAYIRGLESLGQCQNSYDDLLVPIIMKKLPAELRRNMAREHGTERWQLQTLRTTIAREISILEAGNSDEIPEAHIPTASFFTGAGRRKNSSKKPPYDKNKSQTKKYTCPFCEDKHQAHSCEKVKDVKERLAIVKSKRLCYNCLGNHQVSDCRSKFRCRTCQRKHHSSICEQNSTVSNLNPEAVPFENSTSGSTGTVPVLHSTTQEKSKVLLKTAVAEVSSQGYQVQANILFDEGAQRSFITQELAEKLKLRQTESDTISLASFGGSSQQLRSIPKSSVYLHADNNTLLQLDVLIVPRIAVPLPNLPIEVKGLDYLKGLKLAHPPSDIDGDFEVSLLIGADFYWRVVQDNVIRGNGPTAVKSKIGYLLSGPIPVTKKQSSASHILNVITAPPSSENLERFWTLEGMGISSKEADVNTTSGIMDMYKENSIVYEKGHYVVKLPWKDDHPILPANYELCKKRLIGITKTALKKVLGRSYVTYQTLQTVITEIEAILNDRPLTYVTSGTTDEPVVLTPSHLIYGRRITQLPYDDVPVDAVKSDRQSVLKRAAFQMKLINLFRDRWRHEYLTALRERHQTSGNNHQTISIGDVVQVYDDTPRSQWKLAIVEELVRGRDGLVRSAKIRTQSGVTNRAIVKLYPLEVSQ